MQGRQRPRCTTVEDRKVKMVDVEVKHVELRCHRPHPVEHHHVIWNWIAHSRIQPTYFAFLDVKDGVGGLALGEDGSVLGVPSDAAPLADFGKESFRIEWWGCLDCHRTASL